MRWKCGMFPHVKLLWTTILLEEINITRIRFHLFWMIYIYITKQMLRNCWELLIIGWIAGGTSRFLPYLHDKNPNVIDVECPFQMETNYHWVDKGEFPCRWHQHLTSNLSGLKCFRDIYSFCFPKTFGHGNHFRCPDCGGCGAGGGCGCGGHGGGGEGGLRRPPTDMDIHGYTWMIRNGIPPMT